MRRAILSPGVPCSVTDSEVKGGTAVIPDGAKAALCAPLAELKKALFHISGRTKTNVHRGRERVTARGPTDIHVIGFRPPPVVDQADLETLGFEILNEIDRLKCVRPSRRVRMNQTMGLTIAVGAAENVDA